MATKSKLKATKQEPKPIWLIMRVHMWSSMEFTSIPILPFPIKFDAPSDGSIGFCEAFDDHEKALAAAKDGDMIVPCQQRKLKDD